MIDQDFQDSENSESGDDELVIKPPQSSSELEYVIHHKDEKKLRHSKKYKLADKRHHHHYHHHHHGHNHKSRHLKSSSAIFSNRNLNMERKSFHYKGDNEKDQNRESEKSLTDQHMVDTRSRKIIKDVAESNRKGNVKYDEKMDVRDARLLKDIRESRRYNKRNEERNKQFFEEKKLEWRKKRLQWIQHQVNENGILWTEKEDFQGTGCEKECNEHCKNAHIDYFRNEKNITNHFEIDDENYSLISLVSSEEESMNYEETEVPVDKHVSDQENSTKLSDISSDDNDGKSSSDEESEDTGSITENGKNVSQKGSPATKPSNETETIPACEENLNTKPIEENGTPVMTVDNGSSVDLPEVHKPELPVYYPAIQGCRSVDGFHVLNRIEEGTYGVVYRARDKNTKEIVALKRLKMEREKEGFPITSLREINTLLKAQHHNIVTVREIVVGSHMDRIYIVMDYVEHDLKSLMKIMPRTFLIGEVKTLLMQLLCAVAHLHDNWILHRDLKTSNLLLSHAGILKVGDFGLAREYGSPLKSYTPVVVTLWYRAPELLLGAKKYSTPIDMWSVGCIFGELLTKNAIFPGKSESDQINKIFKDLGTPSENIWPGYSELPLVQSLNITRYPYNNLKSRFSHTLTDLGFELLNKFLTYNPVRRISAEKAKDHAFFNEKPRPVPPNMFPTWPAKSEQHDRTARSSPKPPLGGIHYSSQ